MGCGAAAPSVSATKVADFSESFIAYADAVSVLRARWAEDGTIEEDALAATYEDLAIIEENLRAESRNVRIDATAERLEKLGGAIGSLPFPWAKVAGWGLVGVAGLTVAFGRKKKRPISGGA